MSAAVAWLRARPFASILVLAFVLRAGWGLAVPVALQSDCDMYDVFARQILASGHYRFPGGPDTLFWPVGTPAIFAAVYYVLGEGPPALVAANLALGVGLVAAVGALGTRRFGARIGLVAALLTAVWPTAIMLTTFISSELPFMLLVVLALLAWSAPGRRWWQTAAVGALLVAASYVRPTALPLLVALPATELILTRRPLAAARSLLLMLGVAAVLLAPWAARNRALVGSPVLVSANFGANLWMGNNPASDGGYMDMPARAWPNEAVRDADLKREAVAFISAYPGAYARLVAQRVLISFDRETIGVVWNAGGLPQAIHGPLKVVASFAWAAILLLGIVGFFRSSRAQPMTIFDPLVVTGALFAATALLVVGMDRYHLPLVPILLLFAATCFDRSQSRA